MANEALGPSVWKILAGFVIGPLIASIVFTVTIKGDQTVTAAALQLMPIVCVFAYSLTFVFGLPAYMFLSRVMRLSLWVACLVGGLVAALPFVVAQNELNRFNALFTGFIFIAGTIGGAVFYLVVAGKPNSAFSLRTGNVRSRPKM